MVGLYFFLIIIFRFDYQMQFSTPINRPYFIYSKFNRIAMQHEVKKKLVIKEHGKPFC